VFDAIAPNRWRVEELTVNYRTPSEIMAVAAGVLRTVDPDAVPPVSVRDSGVPPVAHEVDAASLSARVAAMAGDELQLADGGTVGVLVPAALLHAVRAAVVDRLGEQASGEPLESAVSVLTVEAAKGLEFDNVVLVEPAAVVEAGANGLRDLYVALTRATQRLNVVHARPLPAALAGLGSVREDPLEEAQLNGSRPAPEGSVMASGTDAAGDARDAV
jgi:superfamily I DNA/RNA helicase